jgi:catechol 2,3-dioxygenase
MPEYKAKIGHAHIKVNDLQKAVEFYIYYLDLKLVEQVGDHYVFLSGSEFHHEIALQNIGEDAPEPIQHGVGLYHIAFEVPDKKSFAQAYQVLKEGGVRVGAVDLLISWAMYFDDPSGNGLEIYVDTRHESDGAELWYGKNVPLCDKKILVELAK